MDWDEAVSLVDRLFRDGRYRDSMLIASGCFLGLRISDILQLHWKDLCTTGMITIVEKKTGKNRKMKVNHVLCEHARKCREALGNPDENQFIFAGQQYGHRFPITRQRAAQILKNLKTEYDIRSAAAFSTHTLRKTFGRRVWTMECKKGRGGEYALLLLKEVFNHANISVTQRYLGIRQEEILSVYDKLA